MKFMKTLVKIINQLNLKIRLFSFVSYLSNTILFKFTIFVHVHITACLSSTRFVYITTNSCFIILISVRFGVL